MTLILKLDQDMVKMYVYIKNEVPSFSDSKIIAWTGGHTDPIEIIAYLHTRMVIIVNHHVGSKYIYIFFEKNGFDIHTLCELFFAVVKTDWCIWTSYGRKTKIH